MIWEKITCPLCHGSRKQHLMRFHPRMSTIALSDADASHGLDLVRCRTCALVYLDFLPTPGSMEEIYASEHYFGTKVDTGYADYDKQQQTLTKTFFQFLKKICSRLDVCGSLADIGCGSGLLLDQARPWFSLRVGSDMSPAAVNQASFVCDRAVVGGPSQILAAGFSGFDLVTAVSVLEHVYDPVLFLQNCGRLTRPGGYIALTLPDFDGFWRRVMGRFWTSFKIPEHLSYWDKKSLAELGRQAGLQVKQFMPYHHYFPLSVVLDKLGMGGVFYSGCRPGKNHKADLVPDAKILLPCVMQTVIYAKPV